MQNKLRVASLFCGCGGSDLGMVGGFNYLGKRYEELPFEIVYAADFDKWAVETYNKNFKHKAVCADVTEVDFRKVPDVDVMIGGFPCQSFSTVNPTKDTNDDRANLYKQIVRFLQTKQPKYFICENVKGLITLQGGSIVNKIISEFASCGYRVQFKLMKAVEFGIPQRRERVIIIGIRNDIVFNYEYPKATCSEANATPLSSVIDELAIEEQKYYFSQRAVQGVKNAKNNMKRGLWQDLSKPCLTITAHLAKTSMNSRDPILLVDAEKELYRRFTPREAARIQSFPDEFLLNDSEPKSYKQIGNAVPPVFMWYVAKQLEKAVIDSGNLSSKEIKEYMEKHPAGAFSPAVPKEEYVQLTFMDMIDFFEDGTVPSGKLCDSASSYRRYKTTIYPTGLHDKLFIARGNAFDFKTYMADGIAAFVNKGEIGLSTLFKKMMSKSHVGIRVSEFIYNEPGTIDPTPDNIAQIVGTTLDSLVKQNARIIVMPPIKMQGLKAYEQDSLTIKAILAWLNKNQEKVERLIVSVGGYDLVTGYKSGRE